jgi:hypothetical protein
MIKMAINFKIDKEYNGVNVKDYYTRELKKRGFNLSYSSMGTLWVYDINVIRYNDLTDSDGFKITLENSKDFNDYSIYLEDLEYFEIHKEQ